MIRERHEPYTWPPASLLGLVVEFGEQNARTHRWERQPSARFSCRCGFSMSVTGAGDVADFTATVPAEHRAACRFHHPTKDGHR